MLKTKCYRTNHINYNLHSEPKCDLFIDYNFTKTESSRLVLGKILLLLQSQGTTYYIATEEDFGYAPRVLSKLQCAKTVLIYGDCCFDFGVDSSIVQVWHLPYKKKSFYFLVKNYVSINQTRLY